MTLEPNLTTPPWVLRELQTREKFHADLLAEPASFFPFLRSCRNRVLLVADGNLDFSEAIFGLAFFVRTLLDTPGRFVHHEITLGHIDAASSSQMMAGEARIAGRHTSFKFDDSTHFTPDMYDVVMMFGIRTSFFGRGTASDGNPYPTDRLADPELQVLTEFMNGGGGLFATGDHGLLGRALSHAVPRARNMRLWQSTAAQEADDQVSMDGPWRNDTNRGGLFDSQSDDVPQRISPTLYTGGVIVPVSYPHPLLCGPDGVIGVMPDHPHEGQCVEPDDTSLVLSDGSKEYPDATDGGDRPLPEIISTSRVPTGNVAEKDGVEKLPTHAQEFGGICAYDGHRAGVGRVVTDATWHHFVNTNLKGDSDLPAPFDKAFLTTQGTEPLKAIRAYHRNLVVWTSRAEQIQCMNLALIWDVLFDGNVLEAVLSTTEVRMDQVRPSVLRLIGVHARDALGRKASQCQSLRLVIDMVLARALPDLIPDIDPWRPQRREFRESVWIDDTALVDIALGGALVALRQAVDVPTEESAREVDVDALLDVIAEGGAQALGIAAGSLEAEIRDVNELLLRRLGSGGSERGS
jgi:hypothetical protein